MRTVVNKLPLPLSSYPLLISFLQARRFQKMCACTVTVSINTSSIPPGGNVKTRWQCLKYDSLQTFDHEEIERGARGTNMQHCGCRDHSQKEEQPDSGHSGGKCRAPKSDPHTRNRKAPAPDPAGTLLLKPLLPVSNEARGRGCHQSPEPIDLNYTLPLLQEASSPPQPYPSPFCSR